MAASNIYKATTPLSVPVDESFAYHERSGALERLIPPWESIEIELSDNSLKIGSEVVLKTSLFGIPLRWVARHTEYDPPGLFADTQVSGPFARWDHRHCFESNGEGSSTMTDEITYCIPMGMPGRLLGSGLVRHKIESMFAYRHRVTRDDLELSAKNPIKPMRVAISGSTGLVGSGLKNLLNLLGHKTRSITRSVDSSDSESIAGWSSEDETQKFNEVDTVIHLAGKPIAGGRWSDDVRKQIRESRVEKTRRLCDSLARLSQKPKTLICASATGIYGDRGDQWLTERSEYGADFLANVAAEWELACRPAVDAGIRVVHARFGLVLSPKGGALEKMLLPAKFAGGALGSGQQWWSWIALDDVLGAIYHVMSRDEIQGPVNFVSPEPTTNREFSKVLGSVIRRPALFPAPASALRLALGEMADALLLASCRVKPTVLEDTGYEFRFTSLDEALSYMLGYKRLESE